MNAINSRTAEALAANALPVSWGVMFDGVVGFIYSSEEAAADKLTDLRSAGVRGAKLVPVQLRNG